MKHLLKNSGLNQLKGLVHYCAECRKLQVHYTTSDGWPICHACGYNAELARLCGDDLPAEPAEPRRRATGSATHYAR